jgi:signal recognition particle receptor subunit beta
MQYNKRDLAGCVPVEEMSDALNFRAVPEFEATAVRGDGVFETLRSISELVLRRLSQRYRQPIVGSGTGQGAGQ